MSVRQRLFPARVPYPSPWCNAGYSLVWSSVAGVVEVVEVMGDDGGSGRLGMAEKMTQGGEGGS